MLVDVSARVKRYIKETIDRMMAGAEADASEQAFCNAATARPAGSPVDVKDRQAELAALAKLQAEMDTARAHTDPLTRLLSSGRFRIAPEQEA